MRRPGRGGAAPAGAVCGWPAAEMIDGRAVTGWSRSGSGCRRIERRTGWQPALAAGGREAVSSKGPGSAKCKLTGAVARADEEVLDARAGGRGLPGPVLDAGAGIAAQPSGERFAVEYTLAGRMCCCTGSAGAGSSRPAGRRAARTRRRSPRVMTAGHPHDGDVQPRRPPGASLRRPQALAGLVFPAEPRRPGPPPCFYDRPGVLPPPGDLLLVPLRRPAGRDLHAPADPVQQHVHPRQRVLHPEPPPGLLRDPRQQSSTDP